MFICFTKASFEMNLLICQNNWKYFSRGCKSIFSQLDGCQTPKKKNRLRTTVLYCFKD